MSHSTESKSSKITLKPRIKAGKVKPRQFGAEKPAITVTAKLNASGEIVVTLDELGNVTPALRKKMMAALRERTQLHVVEFTIIDDGMWTCYLLHNDKEQAEQDAEYIKSQAQEMWRSAGEKIDCYSCVTDMSDMYRTELRPSEHIMKEHNTIQEILDACRENLDCVIANNACVQTRKDEAARKEAYMKAYQPGY
jgi:hypothetical protein